MTNEEKEAKLKEIKELFNKQGLGDVLQFEAPCLTKQELENPIDTVMKNMISISTNLDILNRRGGIYGKTILPCVLFTKLASDTLLEEVVHPSTPPKDEDEDKDAD